MPRDTTLPLNLDLDGAPTLHSGMSALIPVAFVDSRDHQGHEDEVRLWHIQTETLLDVIFTRTESAHVAFWKPCLMFASFENLRQNNICA